MSERESSTKPKQEREKEVASERARKKKSPFGLFVFYNVDVKSKNITDPEMEWIKKGKPTMLLLRLQY